MPIENVSDTARWVAGYRAMETARKRALFNDPYAARLAGERGMQMARDMPRRESAAWSMAVRTAVFDEIVLDLTRGASVDLVVNLAAGLDARPWRLELPKSLRWVDVDLPAMLEYKANAMARETPRVRYETVAVDLREMAVRQALFAELGRSSQRALVLSEGLLVYLTASDVGALATDLHAQPSFQWWAFDLLGAQLMRMIEKSWGDRLTRGNARFQFAPEESTAFFEKFGWREKEFRSMAEEGRRLGKRAPRAWVWWLVGRFIPAEKRELLRRYTGVAVLERR